MGFEQRFACRLNRLTARVGETATINGTTVEVGCETLPHDFNDVQGLSQTVLTLPQGSITMPKRGDPVAFQGADYLVHARPTVEHGLWLLLLVPA